ncbi:hypothetical protein JV173_06330 [Acholeplasma equirhinis]|uniref:hypothetical protein n=1 Tax=Acholeplasma equirhinis TaxID=555393 RepID=UPI00197ADB04|nr:hypothetical protein [Acholeplasma equirhinis]MBN3491119.1 hypothetical protein [Acholeplasma equirhinis]
MFESIFTFLGFLIIPGLISFPISSKLKDIKKPLVFLVPGILLVCAILCFMVVLLNPGDMLSIGFLALGLFSLTATLGSTIASILLLTVYKRYSIKFQRRLLWSY